MQNNDADKWIDAMNYELDSQLIEMMSESLQICQIKEKAIRCKWVHKKKFKAY
jgi:hypothetical protein